MIEYTCHAVVKGMLVEDKFNAVSAKQAWYFFCKKYSFSNRDFKVIGEKPVETETNEQIKFAI